MDDATLVQPRFVVDRPGTYVLQLLISDGQLPSLPATVTITTHNSRPVANAGPAQSVLVGSTVQLDGSASSDVDGDRLTFRWAFLSRPTDSTATLSNTTVVQPTFVVDLPGGYVLQLLVNDGSLDSAPATVTITTHNSRPMANAGPDQTVTVGTTVQLDGSASSDVDGDPLTYRWSLSSIPPRSTAVLSDPTRVNPTFVVDQPSTYVAQLLVNDGQVDSAPATVRLSTQNSRPVADAGPDQTVFHRDTVFLDGSASSDADGDPLTYTWSLLTRPEGSAAVLVAPGSTEEPPIAADTVPWRTSVADLPGTYVAQLIVHDGLSASAPDTVVITADNRAPVAQVGADQTVVVGTAVQLDGGLSSDPDGDPLTYAWTWLARPTGSSTTLTGATTSAPRFVPGRSGVYRVQLVVHDGFVASPPAVVTITAEPAPLDVAQLTVTMSPTGQTTVTGQAPSSTPGSTVTATNTRTTQRVTVSVAADGRFTLTLAAQVGDMLTLVLTDATNLSSVPATVTVGRALPPDPATVAPPLSLTAITPFADAVAFLWSGPTPIQVGVAPNVMAAHRVAVIRGLVQVRGGVPLSGVTVSIKDHPEFGDTLSRSDGRFDLAVNGGGILTVQYAKPGYLPVQRQLQTPWRDYVAAEDVAMIPLDAQVTTIALNATQVQVAQGSPSTDADGTRQVTLFFLPGTTAQMRLADGTMQALSSLHVRATEYTVGPQGRQAMPGPLPPAAGYTYAVELSVDEALAVGATRVEFSQPVPLYVDNFLHFPVGGIVPLGWYSRESAAWIPAENGLIVRLLGTDGEGRALLDVDGSGQAAQEEALAALGLSADEQRHVALTYPVGTSLWRVLIPHFTPWDTNWPNGPPEDADPPPVDAVAKESDKDQ